MFGNTKLTSVLKRLAANMALSTAYQDADPFTPGHESAFVFIDWTKGTETELQWFVETEVEGRRYPLSVVSSDVWTPQNDQSIFVTGRNLVKIVELPEVPVYMQFKGVGTVSGAIDAWVCYLERQP